MVTSMENVSSFISQSGLQLKDVAMQEVSVYEATQHKVYYTEEPLTSVTHEGHVSSIIPMVSAKR